MLSLRLSKLITRRFSSAAHLTANVIPDNNIASVQKTTETVVTSTFGDEFRIKHQITIKGALASSYDPMVNFESTPFNQKLLRVFKSEKYEQPTPIQAQAWPIILAKKDVISIARTGSGKTCGFLLPALHDIIENAALNTTQTSNIGARSNSRSGRSSRRTPLVLVVAPTRELGIQIESEAHKYASAVGLQSLCVYGGSPKFAQIKSIQNGVDIIVGTPGRLNDLLEMGALDVSKVAYLVLDEADRM